jgi:hypothetical protein
MKHLYDPIPLLRDRNWEMDNGFAPFITIKIQIKGKNEKQAKQLIKEHIREYPDLYIEQICDALGEEELNKLCMHDWRGKSQCDKYAAEGKDLCDDCLEEVDNCKKGACKCSTSWEKK